MIHVEAMALEKKKKVYACIVGMLSYWKLKLDGGENKEGVQGEKVKKGKSDTRTSNVVAHHRTNRARPCLTSEIRCSHGDMDACNVSVFLFHT